LKKVDHVVFSLSRVLSVGEKALGGEGRPGFPPIFRRGGGRWGDREVVEYGRTCTCRRFLLTEKQMSGIARDSPATRGF